MTSATGDARIERGVWLSDRVLLLIADVQAEGGQSRAHLQKRDGEAELEINTFVASRDGERSRTVVIVVLGDPGGLVEPSQLAINVGDSSLELGSSELADLSREPRVAALALGGLDASIRTRLLEFLARTLGLGADGKQLRLRQNLYFLREAMRERLPGAVLERTEPHVLAAESILAVDEDAFYLKGWVHDEYGDLDRLTAVSPEGARAELADSLFRHRRADIEHLFGRGPDLDRKHGFVTFFELGVPSLLPSGWVVEMRNAAGEGVESRAEDVVSDPAAVRDTILRDLNLEGASAVLMERHAFPVFTRVQERARRGVQLAEVTDYGRSPSAPDVSVVVPLYRRIDLLEHQLAQFAGDPEIHGVELLYVLDSPELAEALAAFATQLHGLYRVPFRVAVLARNAGYAGANNIAAELARGRLLLLLNSDVIPAGPGWLEPMVSFYDGTEGIGALGPKLLYEDDSLQHAGLYFRRDPGASVWENAHYFKGMHRTLPAANQTRPVPAVTGACLMIEKDLYEQVGGLRGLYVQGDNEDSDLCLRLLEGGRRNWYLPEVELYHLEGQSYSSELRTLARRYNDWLQTRLWGDHLGEVTTSEAQTAREDIVA